MFFLSLSDQSQVAIILAVLFGLLVWGRWRYDGIVLITLAFMVMMDLVPAKEAFMGFGHPAVITVGTAKQRRINIATIVIAWLLMGVPLSFKKGEMGPQISWISSI